MGFMQKTADQLELLEQMIHRTGGNPADVMLTATDQDVRSAMFACLGCRNTAVCKAWLAEDRSGSQPPSFCPNASRLKRLQGN